MKISIEWLKELVDLKVSDDQLIKLLPLRTVGIKETTPDFIELDMKGYNRADLLSMRGVAYEVAAITNSPVKFTEPDEKDFIWHKQKLELVEVNVEDKKLAPVYCIAKIENLKVEQSNETWKHKLFNCGLRPVNNIADVTNLIMLEYGQPLHAFDAREVKDETIVVRRAKKSEKIITLDNKTRVLEENDLLITDPEKPVGIAGVMGGKNSEISDSTNTILLEAAIFDPINLRKTAMRLGLPSEASKRFQHGLTKKRLYQALDAAIRMYQSLGGKLTALTIVDNYADKKVEVELSTGETNLLIGVNIKPKQVEKYLKKLNFSVSSHMSSNNNKTWKVIPPYYRLDITIKEDVIEEVARMYGYEKIPPQKLQGKQPEKIDQSLFELIYNLKKTLTELGLTEVQTYSFYSTQVLENLGWNKNDNKKKLVKIANPISSETEYLRENLWPNLVEVIAKNLKAGFSDIAIFEIGKIYYVDQDQKVAEKYALSLALLNGTDNPINELSQIFKKLNEKIDLEINLGENTARGITKELFHPNRFLSLLYKGKQIGGIAEIHKRVTDKFDIESRVAVLEVDYPT